MRFPLLALATVLVAAPAMALPSYAPMPVSHLLETVLEPAPIPIAEGAPQSAASDGQAIFSEPTEPVPLMPSQRKMLRMRKV